MTNFRPHNRNRKRRKGTTTVELAFVLPIYLTFLCVIIEFGHAQLVNSVLRSATRSGARLGATTGQTTADVEAEVRRIIDGAVDAEVVDVYVKDGGDYDGSGGPSDGTGIENLPNLELADAQPRQLFLVRAKVSYASVAILPIDIPYLGRFLKESTIEAQAFMRHE